MPAAALASAEQRSAAQRRAVQCRAEQSSAERGTGSMSAVQSTVERRAGSTGASRRRPGHPPATSVSGVTSRTAEILAHPGRFEPIRHELAKFSAVRHACSRHGERAAEQCAGAMSAVQSTVERRAGSTGASRRDGILVASAPRWRPELRRFSLTRADPSRFCTNCPNSPQLDTPAAALASAL